MKDDQMVRAAQAREEEGVLNEAQDSVKAEIDGVALDAARGRDLFDVSFAQAIATPRAASNPVRSCHLYWCLSRALNFWTLAH